MKLFFVYSLLVSIIGVHGHQLKVLPTLLPYQNERGNQIPTFNFTRIIEKVVQSINIDKLSDDGKLNFTGIANKYGFECEEHQVITEDGYILTHFRIPGDVNKVALLAHGGTPTSDCWIIRAKTSLAIKLAQKNYDVWAMNFRGTRYSRSHISLDPDRDMRKFFNFTLLEQGIYDLPATIDYILKKTGQKQMTAISHSLGTTAFFILGAEKPNYNAKIKLHVPLAPITYIKNVRGLVSIIFNILKTLSAARLVPINADGGIEFANRKTRKLLQAICIDTIISDICLFVVFALTGFDPPGMNTRFLSTLFGHLPGGTSTKVYKLMIQNALSEKFAKFDYGIKRNLEVYQSVHPPEFDLSKVTMKTAMVMGKEDFVATLPDTQRIRDSLPNVVQYEILPYSKFTHLDFVYGSQMETNLYPYLFPILEKFEMAP